MYFMNGIHRRPSTTKTPVVRRPTVTSCRSLAPGRSFRYTSQVSNVEQELKTEARELISAASIPASTRPLSPTGSRRDEGGIRLVRRAAADVVVQRRRDHPG